MIMSHLSITRLVHLASGEHVKLATKMAFRNYQVELPNASECAVKNFCAKLWKEHFSPPKSAVKLAQKIDSASNMSGALFWWLMKEDNFLIYEVPSTTLNNNVLDR